MNRGPVSPRQEGLLLLGADIAGLFICFNVAHKLRIGIWLNVHFSSLYWLVAVILVGLYIFDVYHCEAQSGSTRVAARTVLGITTAGVVIASIVYIIKPWEENVLYWRSVLPVAMVMFTVWATSSRLLVSRWIQKRSSYVRWLVLGFGERAYHLWQDFKRERVAGTFCFLTEDGQPTKGVWSDVSPEVEVLGTVASLDNYLDKNWTGIVTAVEAPLPNSIISTLMHKRLGGLRVYDLTDFYERFLQKVPVINLQDGWFALAHGFDLLHHDVALRVKRLIDMILSVIFILLMFPVFVFVPLAVLVDNRGPIFYNQRRTGLNGREFKMHKFRTMVPDAEERGVQWAQENDPRVTRVGRVLRSMRIDELPQLWNVLIGEMSFIGPRPERPDFNRRLEKTIPYYDLRHLVKPGITGWAQVMYPYGASETDAREKIQYDLYYIKNYSLLLDLVIVLKTIRVVLFGRGR